MKPAIRNPRHAIAFTLVELLVTVAIMVVLMSILLPSMEDAMARARVAKCLANEHGITAAINTYLSQHDGKLAPERNWQRWHPGTPGSVDETQYISAIDANAYWGVAYRDYGAVKKMHGCPDATDAHSDYEYGNGNLYSDGSWAAGHRFTTYGFNHIGASSDPQFQPYSNPFYIKGISTPSSTWKTPGDSLLFMDHFESGIDGNGDVPYKWNQAVWSGRPTAKQQHYRHMKGAAMAWADGHASHHQPKFGWETSDIWADFQIRWFSGGKVVDHD